MQASQHAPGYLLWGGVWIGLALSSPDHQSGKVVHLKSQRCLPRRRHLPPDGHLLRVQRAQATAQLLGIAYGRFSIADWRFADLPIC